MLYKPFGLLVSVLGGILAGSLFKQVWRLLARESEAPAAKDQDRTWREVIAAAAIQGAGSPGPGPATPRRSTRRPSRLSVLTGRRCRHGDARHASGAALRHFSAASAMLWGR